MLIPSFIIAC